MQQYSETHVSYIHTFLIHPMQHTEDRFTTSDPEHLPDTFTLLVWLLSTDNAKFPKHCMFCCRFKARTVLIY